MNKVPITPKTKIAELLKNFPELEDTLIEISPEFAKLRNPILRNTVAKITSLEQAAIIGKINIGILINTLRKKVGQEPEEIIAKEKMGNDFQDFDESLIIETIDARPIISNGGHPLQMVLNKLATIKTGEIICLITPFAPIPMIETARERRYSVMFKEFSSDEIRTYFKK